MNIDKINNSTIISVYVIDRQKVAEICRIPHQLFQPTGLSAFQGKLALSKIVDLNKRLHQLNDSVKEYGGLCFFWKIIGIFTGTFWNYKRLKSSLEFVIAYVDDVAKRLIAKPTSESATVKDLHTLQLPKSSVQPVVSSVLLAPATATTQPISIDSTKCALVQPSLPPPKDPSAARKFTLERIKGKIKIITAAKQLVEGHLANPAKFTKDVEGTLGIPLHIQTAHKANEFFAKAMAALKNGEDTPLPRWFHATGKKDPDNEPYRSVRRIIDTKKLKVNQALWGSGVYLSTCDEHKHYGLWTFAFDDKALENTSGHFHPAESSKSTGFVHPAIYARLDKDLPVSEDSIAFMISDNGREDALRTNVLQPSGFNVNVFNRDEARAIYMYLELADQERQAPSDEWMRDYKRKGRFPTNMKPEAWDVSERRAWEKKASTAT